LTEEARWKWERRKEEREGEKEGCFRGWVGGVFGDSEIPLRMNTGGREKVEERERVREVVDSRGFAKRSEERFGYEVSRNEVE